MSEKLCSIGVNLSCLHDIPLETNLGMLDSSEKRFRFYQSRNGYVKPVEVILATKRPRRMVFLLTFLLKVTRPTFGLMQALLSCRHCLKFRISLITTTSVKILVCVMFVMEPLRHDKNEIDLISHYVTAM